jgi:hypothetical protein
MDNTQISDASDQRQERLLTTLERLLELPAIDGNDTIQQAVQLITEVLDADKVDAFFHDTSTDTLVARGTSDPPMGRRQKAIGLDRIPLANGGRMVEVFLTGNSLSLRHITRSISSSLSPSRRMMCQKMFNRLDLLSKALPYRSGFANV